MKLKIGTSKVNEEDFSTKPMPYECSTMYICCVGVLWPFDTFQSFRARSVNLSTLFLGKPPRLFTST